MSTDLLNQLKNLWLNNGPLATASSPITSSPAAQVAPASSQMTPVELQARLRELWESSTPSCSGGLPKCATPPPSQKPVAARETPVFVDLETRSTCDLKSVGGRRYASDATTEIVSIAALIDRQVVVWLPNHVHTIDADPLWPPDVSPALPLSVFCGPDLPTAISDALKAGRAFCAHNALGFDAHVWRAKGLPEPREWIDTLPLARAAGLPGGLDDLGRRLFGIGKDTAGGQLMKAMSRQNKTTEPPLIADEDLVRILRYNVLDVLLLAGVHEIVFDCGEPEVMAADQAINNRGVAFDIQLARKLIALERAAVGDLAETLESATGGKVKGSDLRRTDFIRKFACSRNVPLADLRKATVEQLLQCGESIDPEVRVVLEARLAVNRVTVSKLETAIAACGTDGRLRDLLVYHGAHTGRWSGRHVQPQNLPRPCEQLGDVVQILPHVDNIRDFKSALPQGVSVADGISALIRPCFRAGPGKVLCIADFAGVEARGVAWCADEQRQLELFAKGGDNYCDLASQIFGYEVTPKQKRERAVGKIAVLGCGYGMGAKTFSSSCETRGVDLTAANTSADEVIEAYRDRYPAIAGSRTCGGAGRQGGLWKDLERAARRAINGLGSTQAGKCHFYRDGDDLIVRLPSGRRMFYRNARMERGDPNYGFQQPAILFDGPRVPNEKTYGGKLTENVVSGICRDLLAIAIVECERVGLPVVLHVHDEIVIEVPVEQADAALRQLLTIMSTPPTWAAGFPIEVEGFSAERYFKAAAKGTKSLHARQGRIVADKE